MKPLIQSLAALNLSTFNKAQKLSLNLALSALALASPIVSHADDLELSPEMIHLAQIEAAKFLEYTDNQIAGGLHGDLQKPRLESIVEMSPGLWTATIVSEAFYYTAKISTLAIPWMRWTPSAEPILKLDDLLWNCRSRF